MCLNKKKETYVDNVRAMAPSYARKHGESTCESHSYCKLTVLQLVLRLKYSLSALFDMGDSNERLVWLAGPQFVKTRTKQ